VMRAGPGAPAYLGAFLRRLLENNMIDTIILKYRY